MADQDSLHAYASAGEITVARVGENSTDNIVNQEYVGNDHYQSDVVCTTTSGAARFGEDIFDYAVLDEASQASIPSSLIPFSRAERLILAGDHKQLPPYHSSENQDTEALEISLFEQLLDQYDDGIMTTLRTQYRMNEAISAFPNQLFYDGVLRDGSRNRSWAIGPLSPLVAYHVSGTEGRSPSKSYYNETEAELVRGEVQRLFDTGVTGNQIGIITPYSGQVSKITAALRDVEGPVADTEVDTVDSFQGSERTVIIVSFVRSNETGHSGFLTFPHEGPRRLNVAMTRAKRRLVLIGNFDTLSTLGPDKTPETSSASLYASLQTHLEEHNRFSDHDEWEDDVRQT
jgi:superfamily I DNA and/or RNA helicase